MSVKDVVVGLLYRRDVTQRGFTMDDVDVTFDEIRYIPSKEPK